MDEMRIESKFATNIVSQLIKVVLRKRFGYNVDVQLNAITTTIMDGKTHVHLDMDAELNKDELAKILKNIGL